MKNASFVYCKCENCGGGLEVPLHSIGAILEDCPHCLKPTLLTYRRPQWRRVLAAIAVVIVVAATVHYVVRYFTVDRPAREYRARVISKLSTLDSLVNTFGSVGEIGAYVKYLDADLRKGRGILTAEETEGIQAIIRKIEAYQTFHKFMKIGNLVTLGPLAADALTEPLGELSEQERAQVYTSPALENYRYNRKELTRLRFRLEQSRDNETGNDDLRSQIESYRTYVEKRPLPQPSTNYIDPSIATAMVSSQLTSLIPKVQNYLRR